MRIVNGLRSMLGLTMVTGSLGGCAHTATPADAEPVSMANPAALYCERMGGQSIAYSSAKGQYATCRFVDGTEIEEWRYYRQHLPRLY